MGMIEKLKGISNWQTVVVICFYISAVLALTITAIMYDIIWLIAAGATTLGIVVGSLSGVARQSFAAPVTGTNPTSTNTSTLNNKEEIKELQKALAETSSLVGNMLAEWEATKLLLNGVENHE